MKNNVLLIDIMKNDVYIEYTNRDIEYVSFTKAKKAIKFLLPKRFLFSCIDSERSVNFLNSLLVRYKIQNDELVLKQTLKVS